jgi:hypothetical protein
MFARVQRDQPRIPAAQSPGKSHGLAPLRPAHPFTACPRRCWSPVGPPQPRRVPASMTCVCAARAQRKPFCPRPLVPTLRKSSVVRRRASAASKPWACVDDGSAMRAGCSFTHRLVKTCTAMSSKLPQQSPVAKRRSLLCAGIAPIADEPAARHGRYSQVHCLCLL